MLKPLSTLLAIALAAAGIAVATPSAAIRSDTVAPQPAYAAVTNGKTAEKKPRPKAGKRPRKASHAEAPASAGSK